MTTLREHLEAIRADLLELRQQRGEFIQASDADEHAVAALAILDDARREVPPQGYRAVVPCRCVPDPEPTA